MLADDGRCRYCVKDEALHLMGRALGEAQNGDTVLYVFKRK